MGWLYVDDGFPEHPKAIAAGGDACWLWVCGFGFINRNDTAGYLPKTVVARLSDRKNPKRLATRLVEVGLWEDKGDSYYMHDYDVWNAKAMARRAAARKAAETRWSRGDPDAIAHADAMPTHMRSHSDGNAIAMPSPHPHPQSLSLLKSNSDARAPVPRVSETENQKAKSLELCVAAWELLVAAGGRPKPGDVVDFVWWARAYLDATWLSDLLDELRRLDKPPRQVKYLVRTVAQRAAQAGEVLPAFEHGRRYEPPAYDPTK
jgi:hypothetical protein